MTSPTSSPPGDAEARLATRRGFTLIELILVMALLVVAFGITFPALQGFFQGRVLDSEARRLLALTRYGQNRAVSEGVPMVLWIDSDEGEYGLETATGFVEEDAQARSYKIDGDLELEVANPLLSRSGTRLDLDLASPGERTAPLAGGGPNTLNGIPRIQFLPDGYIGETSPEYIALREGENNEVWLVQTTNRLAYELRQEPPERNRDR